MIRRLIIFISLLCCVSALRAQTYFSEHGDWSPTRDTIRMFLVFAEAVGDTDYNEVTTPEWPAGQMPLDPGKYFDPHYLPGNIVGLMTKYYHEASFGKLIVLGDYYDSLVKMPFDSVAYATYPKIANYLNALPGNDIVTGRNFSVSSGDFDKWRAYGSGTPKTFAPDSSFDFFIILWRVNSKLETTPNSGYSAGAYIPAVIKDKVGFNAVAEFVSPANDADITIRHEYAHTLYGNNQMHTGGAGAGRRTNLSSVGGWSNMSSWDSNSYGWNAYDRHRMGWKNPQKQFLTSAFSGDGLEVESDSITLETHPSGGEYVLRDFNTSGDAMRIRLPHVDSAQMPQFLWLENHSQSGWNDLPIGRQGLYAFVQIGKK